MDSIRLPARLESVTEVSLFLKGITRRWNLEHGLANRVELALEEALVNISRYAYPNRAGEVEVNCCLDGEGQLHLEIHDWGLPYNPLERRRPDPSQDLASRRVGGWGVELMRRMVDDLTYTYAQGKNVLAMTFRPRETDLTEPLHPAGKSPRSMTRMSNTGLELRWFFKGTVPADVRDWFDQRFAGHRTQKEKFRKDLYFIVRDREDLGLKLSRGRLEFKCRQESQPFSLSEPRVSGLQETWSKQEWRFAKEYADILALAFGKPNLKGWRVEVQKNRSMRKYQVDALGRVSDLPSDKPAERLFKVELTNLTKHDRPWWTLGMEIAGEPPNLQEIFAVAVQNLLTGHPELDLHPDHSYGYPHWLMHSG